MDKVAGSVLLESGTPVTASAMFVPESPDGSVEVVFTLNTAAVQGKTLVAFETLHTGPDTTGPVIAVHQDMDDTAQTVTVPVTPPETPTTPPSTPSKPVILGVESHSWQWAMAAMMGGVLLLAAAAAVLISTRKRR